MEFPELGENCSEPTCNKLDFLPVKCDACGKIFCSEHMNYEKHKCPNARKKDVQVPVCPLCGSPVPTPRNQKPDFAVSEHIDKECRFDPNKKKINSNKCSLKGCKVKEMIPVICNQCRRNYCLQHRFPDVHHCEKRKSGTTQKMRRWLELCQNRWKKQTESCDAAETKTQECRFQRTLSGVTCLRRKGSLYWEMAKCDLLRRAPERCRRLKVFSPNDFVTAK